LLYTYQKYLILRWLWEEKIFSSSIITNIRILINKTKIDSNIFDYCVAYLGYFGDSEDIDMIYSFYKKVSRDISKATILIGIKKMENHRRNYLYSMEEENYYNKLSIKYAKNH
jgi:hypothetical protein